MQEHPETIPVLRPQLPTAQALMPYLQRIDAARIYSNWGPLVAELSARLERRFGLAGGSVICANSGTLALEGAILATAGRARADRPYALVPDFTFTATALAAQSCGYDIVIASCDADRWSFAPDDLLGMPRLLEKVGVVVPVQPFGRLQDFSAWSEFQAATGIPVVVDAAASFDGLAREHLPGLGDVPTVLSFHATKSFGVGEGGCVIASDPEVAARIVHALNFGFIDSRETMSASINGKMCEYAAAVGLAELDAWDGKRERMEALFDCYRCVFQERRIGATLWGAPQVSFAYILLDCGTASTARYLIASLAEGGIGSRQWYGDGLAAHRQFALCPRVDLHDARAMEAGSLLGLPVAIDLTSAQVERIGDAIAKALQEDAAR